MLDYAAITVDIYTFVDSETTMLRLRVLHNPTPSITCKAACLHALWRITK